jgi:predicted transcriptional regulator
MATTQTLICLPDELVRRFKRNVSVRQRSRFIQRLLEQALPPSDAGDDDPLYQAALAVENDHDLSTEMAEWEVATVDDGLGDAERPARRSVTRSGRLRSRPGRAPRASR